MACRFSFLRRSFWRDIKGRDCRIEVPRIRCALDQAWQRTTAEMQRDRAELMRAVQNWRGGLNLTTPA